MGRINKHRGSKRIIPKNMIIHNSGRGLSFHLVSEMIDDPAEIGKWDLVDLETPGGTVSYKFKNGL